MLALLALAATCAASDVQSDSLSALHARGRSYSTFLASAERRKEMWQANSAWGKVDPDLLARGRAMKGPVRLLVVLEDGCSDSANTIPYLATFADSLGGALDIRLVNSTEGKWVMERHRTSDGRAATPTVVLLDAEGNDAGCWVERPAALAKWMNENRSKLSQQELMDGKSSWYTKDRGSETVREILEMIEHPGSAKCGGNT
jgi:hypothetical protein